MDKQRYRNILNKLWQNYKRNTLLKARYEAASNMLFDRFLAAQHLRDGSLDIFKKILHEAKNKYGLAKDNYYLGNLTKTQYIWQRGLQRGRGISWYDYKMVDLGLGTQLMPTAHREHFSWKSLKIEREFMPDNLISPDNINNCPVENEISIGKVLIVFFEIIDFYNQNYVPSLADDWAIRDMNWIEVPSEIDAYSQSYSDVVVTDAEKIQFEGWRDGQI